MSHITDCREDNVEIRDDIILAVRLALWEREMFDLASPTLPPLEALAYLPCTTSRPVVLEQI
jgi:hypothetical protein